jgi:hypothetical protein
MTDEREGWTSASSAQADELCPGRFLAQKGIPETAHEWSETGDRIHASLAVQDDAGLNLEQKEIYDACNEVAEDVMKKVFGGVPHVTRERRYWIESSGGVKHSAQLDMAARKETHALIIDYKALSGEKPESPVNLQLRDQAVCYEANNPLLVDIAVAIVQPLVTRSPEITLYTMADIQKSRQLMWERIAKSHDAGSPRIPGDLQCRFCKARGVCKEYNAWASAIVLSNNSIMDTPVSQWTPMMRSHFLDRMPAALKWIEDSKEALKELMKNDPNSVPGYHLTPGPKREYITNPQAVYDQFAGKGGDLNQFMSCVGVSKGKLKEQLAEVTKKKGRQLQSELRQVIGDNSEYRDTESRFERTKS